MAELFRHPYTEMVGRRCVLGDQVREVMRRSLDHLGDDVVTLDPDPGIAEGEVEVEVALLAVQLVGGA
jgi:hypothetical protein